MSNQSIVPISDITKLTQLQYKKKPILIWCPPCKGAHAVLQKQLRQTGNKFMVAYINSDQAEELNIEYEIQGVPTIICINGKNQPVDKVIGYDPKKIKEMVERMLKKEVKK